MKEHLFIKNIHKSYDKQNILKDISLSINQGEFFFLLGPSGCGKTTLLKIISGLLEHDSGEIYLNDINITRIPAYKRDVNTVFQNYALFPHMTVFDNIAFGLKMKNKSLSEIRKLTTEALELVKLTGFGNRTPSKLSGGQAQRVALARALVNKPSVLLLDEPLGALDVNLRKQMQLELKQLQIDLGTTFVCVTHDQDEAMALGDRIALMSEGQIIQTDTPEIIYSHPSNRFVCEFVGECNFLNYNGKTIGIRPERVKIKPFSSTTHRSTDDVFSHAVITTSVFTGSLQIYHAKINDGTAIRIAHQNSHQERHFHTGDQVWLSWSHNDIISF